MNMNLVHADFKPRAANGQRDWHDIVPRHVKYKNNNNSLD